MDRYETRIEDGIFYLESSDRQVQVGEMADIIGELGEVYEIQYNTEQQVVPWLDIDDDGILSVAVRETLLDVSFDEEFADRIADASIDEPAGEGDLPERTKAFTDLIQDIWDTKGDPEDL